VLVDDCDATARMLAAGRPAQLMGADVEWRMVPRRPGDQDGPARLARLRNLAVALARHEWLAFLDDDNVMEPDHLATLAACAEATGAEAVHSHRSLFWRDGDPYRERLFPWVRDPARAVAIYRRMAEAGIFSPHDNIVRDRVDSPEAASPIHMVDMGEWLIARDRLRAVGFRERYDEDDWREVVPEDNKLLRDLIRLRVRIESTRRPTLRYFLGGYSNDFRQGAAPADSAPRWLPP
jgi:hypothetical protein